MKHVQAIACALLFAILVGCSRTEPPAPVVHYGIQNKARISKLLIKKDAIYSSFKPTSAFSSASLKTKKAFVKNYASRNDLIWPVHGSVVSSYGPKQGGLYNEGINIAAPAGTAVVAAADGVIAYVGDKLGGYGRLVLIRHQAGMMTAYAHMSKIHVRIGTSVERGQMIGTVGATGAVLTSQLHFEVRRNGDAVDPIHYLEQKLI